jgi:hypothetical protein
MDESRSTRLVPSPAQTPPAELAHDSAIVSDKTIAGSVNDNEHGNLFALKYEGG